MAADLPLRDAVAEIRSHPYSRYPVTGRDVDDVVGFLHVRDLVDAPREGTTVSDVMREIVALPATNQVLPSMTRMRKEGVHIAVVVDEYGGTDGIVTLEDLVEELVGEIRDEYDDEEPQAVVGDTVIDGGLTIEDFADETGVTLEDGQYETVGGYIVSRLGRLAVAGDSVPVDGHLLEVVTIDQRRIETVRVSTDAPTDEPDDSPSETPDGASDGSPTDAAASDTDPADVGPDRSDASR